VVIVLHGSDGVPAFWQVFKILALPFAECTLCLLNHVQGFEDLRKVPPLADEVLVHRMKAAGIYGEQ
jgi:hypothetical protein